MSGLDVGEVEALRSRIDHDVAEGLVHAAQLAVALHGYVVLFDAIGQPRPRPGHRCTRRRRCSRSSPPGA